MEVLEVDVDPVDATAAHLGHCGVHQPLAQRRVAQDLVGQVRVDVVAQQGPDGQSPCLGPGDQLVVGGQLERTGVV